LKQDLERNRETAGKIIQQLLDESEIVTSATQGLAAAISSSAEYEEGDLLLEAPSISAQFQEVDAQVRTYKSTMGSKSFMDEINFSLLASKKASLLAEVRSIGSIVATAAVAAKSANAESVAHAHSNILEGDEHSELLIRFFGNVRMPSKLVYRASRDGFEAKHWREKCLESGPSLTLIKAKSGNIFGQITTGKATHATELGLALVLLTPS
jgi:hypothetical protein